MQNKRIIITGGAGYIGSLLIPKLVKEDYHVIIIDNFTYKNKSALTQFVNHPNTTIVAENILNISKIKRFFKGVDTVVHLAAIVGDQACDSNQKKAGKVNIDGTNIIADVSRKNNVKHFVYSSSCSIYGASQYAIDEYSPLNPLSYYAQTKIKAENNLSQLADNTFKVTSVRFATLFGLSSRMRFDLVVNLLAAKAIYEKKITIFGGHQWRPFLHVDDAASALLQIVKNPFNKKFNIYNVGTNEGNFTLNCVGDIINSLVPNATKVISKTKLDNRNYRVDFSKFIRDYSFLTKWNLEDGIQDVISVLESSNIDYKNKQYHNYNFIKSRK